MDDFWFSSKSTRDCFSTFVIFFKESLEILDVGSLEAILLVK